MIRSRLRRVGRGRGGLSRVERGRMDALARAVVMVRSGATLVPRQDGRGWYWFGRCERCRKERPLQWCHIHSRGSAVALTWDPDNAFAACAECHVFGRKSWHRDVTSALAWLETLRGKATVERLRLRAATTTKADHEARRLSLELELTQRAPWAYDRLFGEGADE